MKYYFILLLTGLFFSPLLLFAQVNLNQGLVGYWGFNGNANDISGNNNNGIVNGAVLATDKWGNANGAYQFDGINDFIEVANSATLNFPNNTFSIYALVNIQGFYYGTCHGNCIADKGNAGDGIPGHYSLRFEDYAFTNGQNCANSNVDTIHQNFTLLKTNQSAPLYYTPPIVKNNWYCVVAVYSGNQLRVYVDGVLKSTTTSTGNLGVNNDNLFFGRKNNAIFPYWFKGIMDEIRIYNRAINTQEIDSLCNYTGPTTIINHYASVQSYDSCTNSITVDNATDFNIGDTILLIQMKGATIDSSNTAAFGNILNYNNAGNYEENIIAAKSGNIITLKNVLLRSYTIPNGKVQIVTIPQFQNYTINKTHTAAPWDGNKGGIFALNVTGTLTMNADIDVSGHGFRGGLNINPSSPNQICGVTDYYLGSNIDSSALKGEGITEISLSKRYGRGKLANGGGAGNAHNAGGGGGGNGGVGGIGGFEFSGCNSNPIINNTGGVPGLLLNYNNTLNKIFLGGGGGAAQSNNDSTNSSGANGGGLVYLRAFNINANNHQIISRGLDAPFCTLTSTVGICHDGMGGGGSGGTVLLTTSNITGNFNIDNVGGNGGSVGSNAIWNEVGPGGGGGGGTFWINQTTIPPNVNVSNAGGLNGIVQYNNATWGAQSGQVGQIVTGLIMPVTNQVFVPPTFITASNDTSVCLGTTAQLNASGATSYSWSPISGLSNPFIPNPIASPAVTTQYVVTGLNSQGCTDRDTVVVTITPGPNVIASASPINVCPGGSTILSSSGAATNYQWSGGVQSGVPIIVNGNTTYTLTATDNNGCVGIDSVTVTVLSNPLISITPVEPKICIGDSLVLTATGAQSYLWSPNYAIINGNTSNPVIVEPGITTTYSVTGTDANGCKGSTSVEVSVLAPPILSLSKSNDIQCQEKSTQLFAEGALNYVWSPSTGLSNPNSSNPTAQINQTTTYIVSGSIGGCVSIDSITVFYYNNDRDGVFVPNAFTPNGDGLNDCFRIRTQGNYAKYELYIYNRWGMPVFESENSDDCWNGTYGGKDVPVGVYYYYLNANSTCGPFTIKGDISVIR